MYMLVRRGATKTPGDSCQFAFVLAMTDVKISNTKIFHIIRVDLATLGEEQLFLAAS